MTKRQKTIFTYGTILAIALIGVVLGWLFLFNSSSKSQVEFEEASVLPVNVINVEQVNEYEITKQYTGILKSPREVVLGFELAGRVIKVFVDEGDRVETGEIIARLDTTALIASRRTAEANLAQALAVRNELEAGARVEVVEASKAEFEAARSDFENARQNSIRRKQLQGTSSISREEYDQAVFSERASKARLNAAEQRYLELKNGIRPEKILAAKATVQQMEARLQEIDVSLAKSVVTAPFPGTIVRRMVHPGSVVNPGQAIVDLRQDTDLEAWVGLPVEVASGLVTGEPLEVQVGQDTFEGKLRAKVRLLSEATRTQSIIVQLENRGDDNVYAGQVCKIQLDVVRDGTGYWVPTTALTRGVRGLWSLMVVKVDGERTIAEKQDVLILHSDVDRSLVSGTMTGTRQVITNGLHRIVPGQLVKPNFAIVSQQEKRR